MWVGPRFRFVAVLLESKKTTRSQRPEFPPFANCAKDGPPAGGESMCAADVYTPIPLPFVGGYANAFAAERDVFLPSF